MVGERPRGTRAAGPGSDGTVKGRRAEPWGEGIERTADWSDWVHEPTPGGDGIERTADWTGVPWAPALPGATPLTRTADWTDLAAMPAIGPDTVALGPSSRPETTPAPPPPTARSETPRTATHRPSPPAPPIPTAAPHGPPSTPGALPDWSIPSGAPTMPRRKGEKTADWTDLAAMPALDAGDAGGTAPRGPARGEAGAVEAQALGTAPANPMDVLATRRYEGDPNATWEQTALPEQPPPWKDLEK